jgi:GGDEF domain-containing protein
VRTGGDFIARLGGDEFGLLSPDSDIDAVESVVERLQAVTPEGVTCSFGPQLGTDTRPPRASFVEPTNRCTASNAKSSRP